MTKNYQSLIDQLGYKQTSYNATIELVGGITSTELKEVTINSDVKQALIDGLEHPNSRVRWQCLQLMDHLADNSFIPHMAAMLDDPVPRVRRHAIHALSCDGCKQDMCLLNVNDLVLQKLSILAEQDENAKVRQEAQEALAKFN